jgi:hypothetical protein
VFVRVLLCVRVALDILGSERLGGVDAADDYVFAVRKTVMSRNAWFECVGSKEAWLEDQLCHVCCCLFFLAPRSVLTGSKLKQHVSGSIRDLLVNQHHFDKCPPRLFRRPHTSIAACSKKILLLANWPCGRCTMSPRLGSFTSQ